MSKRLVLFSFMAVFILLVPQKHTLAKIIFVDDFESDAIGSEPKNWKVVDVPPGDPPGEIVKDPDNPGNKVLLASIRGDRNGRIYVAGNPDMSNYIARFDWYLSKEGIQHGTVFHYTDRNAHYLFDRRSPGAGGALDFYRRQGGGWTNFGRTVMQTDIKTWYTVMLFVQGDTFSVKMKKKSEKDSFAKLKVILEAKDAAFKKGYFGTYASEEAGVAYYDNVVIGETEDEVEKGAVAVENSGKLTSTWGKMKSSF